ncbi:hypothetical protein PHYSODRAFT_323110 [Phytophthora sojae]|uniref:HTH CENPB-type domain-containing protein n=1 Tax=Phytophthora sojae (strain P6497) TaxID=1094619 RepID=G4YE24_PHYSP|nr:hypothetical protein PHYSODRAFT_323110 [Phytophthora sojae]EGZ29605.1 hypothetical protein PHYSODRAFT_323110 [Phytophthora sojae]|eukprot:XP_009516880.1 hypothetical protein PHYSODRAFT_323110 [Phytophthora sojae]
MAEKKEFWKQFTASQTASSLRSCLIGMGAKPRLSKIEDILDDADLVASARWVNGFMRRYGLSLPRTTNLTVLTDDRRGPTRVPPIRNSRSLPSSYTNHRCARLLAPTSVLTRVPGSARPPCTFRSESEEPDDSNDEDSSIAESTAEDGEVTGDSEVIEDDEPADEDTSINLIEVDLHQKVTSLIRTDKYDKVRELMTVYSMLGALMQMDTVERHRDKG